MGWVGKEGERELSVESNGWVGEGSSSQDGSLMNVVFQTCTSTLAG